METVYHVRGKPVKQKLKYESLSHLQIPKIAAPKLRDWGDRLEFLRKENFPVFPLHRRSFSVSIEPLVYQGPLV